MLEKGPRARGTQLKEKVFWVPQSVRLFWGVTVLVMSTPL